MRLETGSSKSSPAHPMLGRDYMTVTHLPCHKKKGNVGPYGALCFSPGPKTGLKERYASGDQYLKT